MAAEQSTYIQVDPETWKPIPGYEGYYEVSDHGRVRSVDRELWNGVAYYTRKGQNLALSTPNHGYLTVGLCRGSKHRSFLVHRLVLSAFVGEAPVGTEGCHNDGDCTNNRLENLRWDTRSENLYDRVRHGTHHQAKKATCKRGHPLEGANLMPSVLKKGHRGCLACNRTHGYLRNHPELRDDYQMISDSYYRVIVSPDA